MIVHSPYPAPLLRELHDNPAQQAASACMTHLCRTDAATLLASHDFERLWPFLTNVSGAARLNDDQRAAFRVLWGQIRWSRSTPVQVAATLTSLLKRRRTDP